MIGGKGEGKRVWGDVSLISVVRINRSGAGRDVVARLFVAEAKGRRDPDAKELAAVGQYAQQFGMANACRFLLNTNEFMFVD